MLMAGLIILLLIAGIALTVMVFLKIEMDPPPTEKVERLMQALQKTAITTFDVEIPVKVNLESALTNVEQKKHTTVTKNAKSEEERVKEIAANFERMKKTQTKILNDKERSVLEGEVPVYYNGKLYKPKVVILDPKNATEEEIMELMEFARSKFTGNNDNN